MPYIMAFATIAWLIYYYSKKPKHNVLAKIIVTDAALNDEFIPIFPADNVYFQFYRVGNGQLTLSGVMGIINSEYYGYTSDVDESMLFSKASTEEHELYSFNWTFISAQHSNASTSLVKIVKSYNNDRISIDLAILNEDKSKFLFKGYMDCSLNTIT